MKTYILKRKGLRGITDTFPVTQEAIFYLGQTRGVKRPNKATRCKMKLSTNDVVHAVNTALPKQHGYSLTAQKGRYGGVPEDSSVLRVLNTGGYSASRFDGAMKALASRLGKRLCQDTVYVTVAKRRENTYQAEWWKKDKRRGRKKR